MKLIFRLIFRLIFKSIFRSFLQVDTINFGGCGQSCLMYPKKKVFKIFALSHEWSGVLIKLFCGIISSLCQAGPPVEGRRVI